MCNGVIVPSYSSKEEKVAKAATVPPEPLADHRRNKPELCIPGISADRCLRQNLWRLELFGLAGLLPLPQRATSQMKRRLVLRGHTSQRAPPDLPPTNRDLA